MLACAVVAAAYFVQSKTTFFVIAVLAGTGLGAIQAAARALEETILREGADTVAAFIAAWVRP